MKYFNFKRRSPASGPHLLGSLLIMAGLFALASPLIFNIHSSEERVLVTGSGAIVLGLIVLSSYGGVLIDFSGRRFKEYRSVSGVKSGEWLPLPRILKVKVTENSYLSTNTPNGISPTLSGKVTVFKMLVYSDDTETMLSFEYASRKKALRDARRLASGLGADLVLSPALEPD